MKMKEVTAIIMSLIMTAGIFVGCGGSDNKNQGSSGGSSSGSNITIGLSTDEGGINDKSFNQSANEGVEKAKSEFGVNYTAIEAQKKEDYEPNLQALVDNGCNLTFAVGYQLADAVAKVAKNNPEANFCIVDSVVEADNVESITFKEEEGSFLVGVIAGLVTKTNKIGFIGGKDQDTIVRFEAGFAAGVASVNPEAATGLISTDGSTPGATVKYADSFADTNKGYELAKSLYESGCDVIYHAAGGVGIGMLQATKEFKDQGKEVWAIGVDMDQAISLPEYADVILTSMVKRVDKATYDAVKAQVDGNFKGGSKVIGIADDGVGVADSSSVNTPEDVLVKVEDYKNKIKAGEIVVPPTRTEVMNFKVQ
ncbi:BMP family lipoprotein [Clostridium culturomicium]|uniref:BMP family lipoprotein n=1 Tax=Clostridium culturomicium TaxID=1499683 RepID=UPI003857494D